MSTPMGEVAADLSKSLKKLAGTTGLEPAACRDRVTVLGFTTTYKDAGDCQSTRKSHKTAQCVGRNVGCRRRKDL